MTIPKCANCGNEANVAIGGGYLCSWCVIQRLDRIPQTVEEVAKAEEEFDESKVVLPPSLRDPYALLERWEKGK